MASKLAAKTRPKASKLGKGKGKLIQPTPISDDESDGIPSADDDSEDGDVDEEGMERLMKALGDNGLDEFDQALLGSLQNTYSDDDEEEEEEQGNQSSGLSADSDDEAGSSVDGKAQESQNERGDLEAESADEEDGTDEDEFLSINTGGGVFPKEKVVIDNKVRFYRQLIPVYNSWKNKVALERIRESIQLDPSLPWTETLTVTYPSTIDVDANDDLKREVAL